MESIAVPAPVVRVQRPVATLQEQNEELKEQHESAAATEAAATTQDESSAAVPGFGLAVAFAAIAATAAFVLGQRS